MKYVVPDDIAHAVGAVNTIDLRDMSATNTDVAGLVADLKSNGVQLQGERVLVLGAGGAARAAVVGLTREGAEVLVVNRSMDRARTMVANLSLSNIALRAEAVTLDEAVETGFSLIVNCTPVGMMPNVEQSPWIRGLPIPPGVTLYDMIYRPAETALMREVRQTGGQAIGGLGMLVYQGASAFKIWTGVEPPIEVMFEAARAQLSGTL